MSDEVDLVVSGHTHPAYNCVIDGRPVSSAASFSRIITDIDLTIDRGVGRADRHQREQRDRHRDVPLDADETALIERYTGVAAPIANRVVGRSRPTSRANNAAGESSLGDHIADAQLEATTRPHSAERPVRS